MGGRINIQRRPIKISFTYFLDIIFFTEATLRGKHMLKSKFILGLLVLFVIVTSFGFYGYTVIRNNLIQEQIEINQAATRALEARISRWLERRKTEISTLANTPVVRSMDWSKSGPFLKQKHEAMPWFYIFAHINPDGTYYNSKVDFAEGRNLSDRAHFQASIEGRVYASDPVVSRTLGTDIVAVTSPIYESDLENSKIIGVFGGMIDTSTIVEELSRFSNGEKSYAFALNSNGIAISHPDPNRMGNINTNAKSLVNDLDPGVSKITKEMLSGYEGWRRIKIDNQDAFVTYTPVTQANWYLATVTDASHVIGQLKALNFATIFFALILSLTFYMVLRLRNAESQKLEAEKSIVEEKNRAKSNFLANVSHELRTPLNAIIGYSDLIQADTSLSNTGKKRVQAINTSGKHLLNLINRILDLAKVEAGKLELDSRPTNLKNFLNDTVKSLEITAQRYPISFSTSIEVDEDILANVDTDKLTQIINNITTNSFKYGGSGLVTFAAHLKHDDNRNPNLCINVVDQGIGMSTKDLQTVFNEFEQIDSKSSGLGLGLAIVKQLTTLMNGEVKITSEKTKGTSVEVIIPINRLSYEELANNNNTNEHSISVDGKGKCILVIDDNEENHSLLKDLFTSNNFKVDVATDGEAGLSLFDKKDYDLVITDIVMPKKNGFEVIREIRARSNNATVPIIVASASAFASDQQESIEAGGDVFMAKPISIRDMLNTTCQLLNIITPIKENYSEVKENSTLPSLSIETTPLQLNASEKEKIQEIVELAELGRFFEIRSIIESTESQNLRELWICIEEPVNDLDSDRIIDIVNPIIDTNNKK